MLEVAVGGDGDRAALGAARDKGEEQAGRLAFERDVEDLLTMNAPGDREKGEVPPEQAAAGDESRRERAHRHVRSVRLYAWSVLLVLALVVIVALIASNTRQVKVSWVVGDSHASLVWVVVVPAVVGWFAGVATAVVFRRRTRAPRR